MRLSPSPHDECPCAASTGSDYLSGNPWRIGWESVKANAIPMVLLWLFAAATVVAYYVLPNASAVFGPLQRWHVEGGWLAAFLNRVFFLGFLPGVFLLAFKNIRPARPVMTIVMQTLWCGVWGVISDWLYQFQYLMFGSGVDLFTLLVKTLFDQFVFTALCNAPANAIFFFWVSRDFSLRRFKEERPSHFVRGLVLPNLVANWCVGFPTSLLMYMFPPPLQLQVSGFIYAFWVLMCLQIGKRSAPAGNGML